MNLNSDNYKYIQTHTHRREKVLTINPILAINISGFGDCDQFLIILQ